MTQPEAQTSTETRPPMNVWLKLFLICLGIALTLPGLCGMLFFGAGMADWIASGFNFSGSGGYNFSPVMVGMGGASLIGSIFLLSILIGANRWEGGKRFCIALAVLGAATTVLGYASLIDETTNDPEGFMLLQLAAIGGLVLGFLPPFLVWRKTRMAAMAQGPDHG